jgi:hypothetical protein
MRTDGRTDVTKLIVAFRNLANATKKVSGARFVAFFSLKYHHVSFWLGSISKAILKRIYS